MEVYTAVTKEVQMSPLLLETKTCSMLQNPISNAPYGYIMVLSAARERNSKHPEYCLPDSETVLYRHTVKDRKLQIVRCTSLETPRLRGDDEAAPQLLRPSGTFGGYD